MNIAQGYISDELSHFVGRGQDEGTQYDILVNKILKTGWLTYAPHDSSKPRSASLDLSKPISTDDIIKYQVVCFCDIPVSELSIHVVKYGKFGLAFRKPFLINKGACPVFYVANESRMPTELQLFNPGDFSERISTACSNKILDRALYFDTSVRGILDLLIALDSLCNNQADRYFHGITASDFFERFRCLLGISEKQLSEVKIVLQGSSQAKQTIRMCTDFLINYVFTFMKCFDANQSFEHATNYYMEREWRIGNNVRFELNDVSRVFFPSKYAQKFHTDLPHYIGQISFTD